MAFSVFVYDLTQRSLKYHGAPAGLSGEKEAESKSLLELGSGILSNLCLLLLPIRYVSRGY